MKKTSPTHSFESALADLESLVAQMETGQLPLEQSLAAYKQGTELLTLCQKTLQDAEQEVRILTAQNTLQDLPAAN